MVRVWALAAGGLLLAACNSGLFGRAQEPALPGERVSVLILQEAIEADPGLAMLEIRLPRPYVNEMWPQVGGHPSNAMHHLALADNLGRVWRTSIGEGSSGNLRLTAPPVVAGGTIFTLDAATTVTATRAADGAHLWRRNMAPADEDRGALGGGLGVVGAALYLATGYGDLAAMDVTNGGVYWVRHVGIPVRGAPTIAGGRVYVVTNNNQLHVFSAETGEELWTHLGFTEVAGLVGGGSPAVAGDLVVVPYSSGEVVALRAETGRVAWSDALTRVGRIAALAELSDIHGQPVIDRGVVYVVGHAGRMFAIDLRSGERLWEQEIASVQTPWIGGDFLYLVTTDAEVVALSRSDGRIRWVQQLARFRDAGDRTGPIQWSGPTLAGDRLIVGASTGEVTALSPYTGRVLGSLRLGDGVFIPPVVAAGALYILTEGAELNAYR